MSSLPAPTEPAPAGVARPRFSHAMPIHGSSPVRLHLASCDRKLAPVGREIYEGPGNRKLRPYPAGPVVCATYVSIAATCPDSCAWKDGGCYVQAGFTRRANLLLDERALGLDPDEVIERECELIWQAFKGARWSVPQDGGRCGESGRDLRLHIGGDTPSEGSARRLSVAAGGWRWRGGGAVWTYTHRWREIPRAAFGSISTLASVESAADARAAVAEGYVPAIVVPQHQGRRPTRLTGWPRGWRALPCPAETTPGRTCVTCRLCLDDGRLRELKLGIAFAAHGMQKESVRRHLDVVS